MTKILIADDNPVHRLLVRDTLEDEGYELIEAIDGLSALSAVKKHRPDVVLLDVLMPGANGMMTLRVLLSLEHAQSMKILILSALDKTNQIEQFLKKGAVDYVTKPFSQSVLREKIRSLVREQESVQLEPAVSTGA